MERAVNWLSPYCMVLIYLFFKKKKLSDVYRYWKNTRQSCWAAIVITLRGHVVPLSVLSSWSSSLSLWEIYQHTNTVYTKKINNNNNT